MLNERRKAGDGAAEPAMDSDLGFYRREKGRERERDKLGFERSGPRGRRDKELEIEIQKRIGLFLLGPILSFLIINITIIIIILLNICFNFFFNLIHYLFLFLF